MDLKMDDDEVWITEEIVPPIQIAAQNNSEKKP
jgi:hypothetical protein